jgi:hypothetical protein
MGVNLGCPLRPTCSPCASSLSLPFYPIRSVGACIQLKASFMKVPLRIAVSESCSVLRCVSFRFLLSKYLVDVAPPTLLRHPRCYLSTSFDCIVCQSSIRFVSYLLLSTSSSKTLLLAACRQLVTSSEYYSPYILNFPTSSFH